MSRDVRASSSRRRSREATTEAEVAAVATERVRLILGVRRRRAGGGARAAARDPAAAAEVEADDAVSYLLAAADECADEMVSAADDSIRWAALPSCARAGARVSLGHLPQPRPPLPRPRRCADVHPPNNLMGTDYLDRMALDAGKLSPALAPIQRALVAAYAARPITVERGQRPSTRATRRRWSGETSRGRRSTAHDGTHRSAEDARAVLHITALAVPALTNGLIAVCGGVVCSYAESQRRLARAFASRALDGSDKAAAAGGGWRAPVARHSPRSCSRARPSSSGGG